MDFRNEFADFDGVAYLDVANQAPLPRAAAQAAQAAIEWKKLPHRMPEGAYFDLPDRVREKTARIIGAEADEIAVTTGASTGFAVVASGFDWKAGDEVLIARKEFPAHFSTWLPYRDAGRLRMRVFEPKGRFVTAQDYVENMGPRTRLISASLVRFDDGSMLEAARVARVCHQAGAAFLLDISQCAGAIPMKVRELGADFAACASYKWLLGPYGTGFFWIAREWIERLGPCPLYWQALEGARNFSSLPLDDPRIANGARRWDVAETGNFINLAALDASLDLALRIGIDAIASHCGELVNHLIDRLPRDRYVLVSPAEASKRGPFVCISARNSDENAALFEKLRAAGIIVSLRENAVRISPCIYNTHEEIERLVKVLLTA